MLSRGSFCRYPLENHKCDDYAKSFHCSKESIEKMKNTLILSFALVVVTSALAPAAIRLVPVDYPTIQAAIDAAVDGDIVIVDPNTYFENINFNGKAITIRSIDPENLSIIESTTIDGNQIGTVVNFTSGEGTNSVLTGFTITNGLAENGAGIYCSYANDCDQYCEGSSPTIRNCIIRQNSATKNGGGMYSYNSSPIVSNCKFTGNSARGGGGAYTGGCDPALLYCTLSPSRPVLTNCTFSGNSASKRGGGIYNSESSATLTNCIFSGNSAGLHGGGLYNKNYYDDTIKPNRIMTLNNCLFSSNSASYDGGGMVNYYSSPTLTNCSFIGNSAARWCGGIENVNYYLEGDIPTLTSCILWGNSHEDGVNESAQISSPDKPAINYCCIQGWTGGLGGTGNIGADPCFVSSDDYHLSADSPCINTGDPDFIPGPNEVDMDGDPRVSGERVDMGTDEYIGYSKPIADAGPDQYLRQVQLVSLDGSGSVFYDPYDVKQFHWTQVAGPPVQLSDTNVMQPTFMPFIPERQDVYRLELIVSDGLNTSGPDEVLIFVGTRPGDLLQTFQNPTPGAGDWFGYSIAALGDNILISAPRDNTAGNNAGAVYLFDANGNLLHTFLNPAPATSVRFGGSITALGNNVLIGAHHNSKGWVAHLFEGSTGTLLQTFHNPTPLVGDNWWVGSVVAFGNNVLIGAAYDGDMADDGIVYLFEGTTGDLLRTFQNPTPGNDDRFGRSIGVAGNNVLVGAYTDDTLGIKTGTAYLFDGSTGGLLQTFDNPTPEYPDLFGYSMAVLGDNILISAPRDNTAGDDAGAVYLFDVDGNLLHTFLNPMPDAEGGFGHSMEAVGNNILIGGYSNFNPNNGGATYLFDGLTGTLLHTFDNPAPNWASAFGRRVARAGNNVLIADQCGGCWGFNHAGAVYLFDFSVVILVGPADGATVDENGVVLSCKVVEDVVDVVGYQLLFGSDQYRMDYVVSDTTKPPSEIITTFPFEQTWWTVQVYNQHGSTIYADPICINAEDVSMPISNPIGKEYLICTGYELVSQKRLSETIFEYFFRMKAKNMTMYDIENISIRLASISANTTILNDKVFFSLLPAQEEVLSDDTFCVRIDRAHVVGEDDIICEISGQMEGDFSGEGQINFVDFAYLASNWFQAGAGLPEDLYKDETIDFKDLALFLESWLRD